ncbi:MAG: hypothetical protein WKF40_03180 [Thermoleophilaceae bacterium]
MPLPFSPEAMEHLMAADPVMRRIIGEHGPLDLEERRRGRPDDSYGALVRSITGQQLSVKAARTIYGRVCALYDGHTPTPRELIETDPDDLRAAGLSYSKAAYLKDLAGKAESGELDLEHLPALEDREVSEMLTAVKGLGQWTADMFMMFHLGRPDVLPVGDLGIRRRRRSSTGCASCPRRTGSGGWRGPGGPTGRWRASTCGRAWTTRRGERGGLEGARWWPATGWRGTYAKAAPGGARATWRSGL